MVRQRDVGLVLSSLAEKAHRGRYGNQYDDANDCHRIIEAENVGIGREALRWWKMIWQIKDCIRRNESETRVA
jgi:hypothetical protein